MNEPWRVVRAEAVSALEAAAVVDPAQELGWIHEQATGWPPPTQVARLDLRPSDRELRAVRTMVQRRIEGEPLQYVLGRWGFRTLDLLVDPRVLIPRPETEQVAGLAIDALPRDRSGVAADLGTGSGAIALSLAAERWPQVEVWATDVSRDALAVARANLAGLGRRAACVRLVEGDWFDALPSSLQGACDVVVSNPPYVADAEALPSEVADWEPPSALRAGPDGLACVKRIVSEAPCWLRPGGALVVEIGHTQGAAARACAEAAGLIDIRIERDLAGRDRALVACRPGVGS